MVLSKGRLPRALCLITSKPHPATSHRLHTPAPAADNNHDERMNREMGTKFYSGLPEPFLCLYEQRGSTSVRIYDQRTSKETRADFMRRAETDTDDGSDFNQPFAEYPLLEEVSLYARQSAPMFCLWKNESTYAVLSLISSYPPVTPHRIV
ncbi:hypothetical protein CBL_06426 [Carabus blaptoides fortunei]